MDSRFQIQEPVDNDKYLDMLFSGFRENKPVENKEYIDKDTIRKVREKVNKAHSNLKPGYIRRPMPQFNGLTLTQESWEECLDYYEIMMDRLSESKPYDIDRLLELELWFYPLIEPMYENDKEKWYYRETTKVNNYHSAYIPPYLKPTISYLIYEKIGKLGAQNHLDKINIIAN